MRKPRVRGVSLGIRARNLTQRRPERGDAIAHRNQAPRTKMDLSLPSKATKGAASTMTSTSQGECRSNQTRSATGSTTISITKFVHQGAFRLIVGSSGGRSELRIRDDVKSQPQSQRWARSGFASEQCGHSIIE